MYNDEMKALILRMLPDKVRVRVYRSKDREIEEVSVSRTYMWVDNAADVKWTSSAGSNTRTLEVDEEAFRDHLTQLMSKNIDESICLHLDSVDFGSIRLFLFFQFPTQHLSTNDRRRLSKELASTLNAQLALMCCKTTVSVRVSGVSVMTDTGGTYTTIPWEMLEILISLPEWKGYICDDLQQLPTLSPSYKEMKIFSDRR